MRRSSFRRYFLADFISHLGSGLHMIGASWFILKSTGLNSSVGLLWAIAISSGLLMLPFSGAIADRYDRLKILIWSNWGRAVLTCVIAGLLYTPFFRIELIYLMALINGFGWNIYVPASQGLVQEILSKEELVHGNAMIEITKQGGLFISAAMAGYLYSWVGFGMILFIDAATFIISNIFLMRLKKPPFVADDVHLDFVKRFTNGWRYLLSQRVIFFFGIIAFLPFVATMTTNVVLPGYVEQCLGKGPEAFGLLDMGYGLGSFLAGILTARLIAAVGKWFSLIFLFGTSLTMLMLLTWNQWVWSGVIMLVGFGYGNTSLRVVFNSTLMELVPKSYMGRCMAVWMLITNILLISSTILAGYVIEIVAPNWGYFFMALLMAVAAGATFIIRPHITRLQQDGHDSTLAAGVSELDVLQEPVPSGNN